VFLHQTHSSFTNFGGILKGRFLAHHGSIFSRKGASSKPGAIQTDKSGRSARSRSTRFEMSVRRFRTSHAVGITPSHFDPDSLHSA
jgi:hypothetical protein